MNWYLAALRNYATFSGRARRREYWYFVLFNSLIAVGIAAVDALTDFKLPSAIYNIAMFIPSIAVFFRRLHDTGRSGWWWLIGLVPVVGWIVILIFLVQDSQAGDNRFGPNPKGGEGAAEGLSRWVVAAIVGAVLVFVAGTLAAVAIPAYQDRQSRARVTAATDELAGFRPRFVELIRRNDPSASLASIGITLSSKQNFSSIYYDAKTTSLVGNLVAPFEGRSIAMQYRRSAEGTAVLICGSRNLEMKYLPAACRNKLDYLDEAQALGYLRV
jgi:uncharacterized membrane protein YhaH (DUF805 family)/Tfp pilus assembly major pilin PilA